MATAMLLLYLLYGMVVPFMHHHGPDARMVFAQAQRMKAYPGILHEKDIQDHQAHISGSCAICDDYISNYLSGNTDIHLPKPILLTVLYVHPPSYNISRLLLAASNKGPPSI